MRIIVEFELIHIDYKLFRYEIPVTITATYMFYLY